MHQQFSNSPEENCDSQMYLGQGRFSNVSHRVKGHTASSAPAMADLEEATRLRMLQSAFCPAPQVMSSTLCAHPRRPVDTSGLKCPIIMMNNQFQRQTDRSTAVGDVDPARDMFSSQQDVGLDKSFLHGSEQEAANLNSHHHAQEINFVPGFHENDAPQASKHRASQYHPVLSSGNRPQSRLCDCSHCCDDKQRTECDSLNVPTHTHLWDQHVQWQASPGSHFPMGVVFPSGQCSGHAGIHQGMHHDSSAQHIQNPLPHNYSPPHHSQNPPPHNYSPPHHSQNPPPHNYSPPQHSQNQPPHNYSPPQHSQRQPPHNVKEPSHKVDFSLCTHTPQVVQHPRMTEGEVTIDPCFFTRDLASGAQTNPNFNRQQICAIVMSSQCTQNCSTVEGHCLHTTGEHHSHPTGGHHSHVTGGHHSHTTGGHHSHATGGHHSHATGGHHSYARQGYYHTEASAFNLPGMSEPSRRAGAYHGRQQMPAIRRGHRHNADIRKGERFEIQSHLVPGKVLQVHGAPMTGKSTIVKHAISDAISSSPQPGQLCDHHIICKGVTSFQDLLSLLAQRWSPQHPQLLPLDADSVLNMICLFLQQNSGSHHILVFHKCECLRQNPHGQQFLEFLTMIVNEFATLSVSIVFTTYKQFWTPQRMSVGDVEVDMLSVIDIISLLQYYVPHIDDCVSYANVLAKTFCFPEAVRLIAEEYLVIRNSHVTPDRLEKIINKDLDLLSQLFDQRLQEVDTWVSKNDLRFLTHFMHSMDNSFTKAHLEYVNSSDLDEVHVQKMITYLKKNHLVRSLPGIRRLVIHPLIVYHSMVSSGRDRQLLPERWLDNTSNRYIHFLGRVLMSIEANMHDHGRKGLVFAGLIQEWPNVQYVFQMALHCNRNTYGNFLKVAITASNYILKIFPREAEPFYWSLYNSAKDYGTAAELAVMEAFLGQAIAEGTGKDWTRADQYLSSAIEHLSRFGNSYFLGWAIIRKAIIYHRQGMYRESIEYFQQASNVLNNANRWALGEEFVVPEPKIDEELITQRIHMAIPIIFTGRNREARRLLDAILDLIQNCFENHPEIATLLNLIGLTEQRGNRDTARALMWYKLSYNERMYWAKACPESLLAVLNNMGMIYFYQGDSEESMKYLEKALAIRRECGWTHYNTGLTLVHVAEINIKLGNLVQAYKLLLEAERIYAATVKDHDVRLRVNFDLAHIRVLIRQALEPREAAREMQSQQSCVQDERSDGAFTQERNDGAEEINADTHNRTRRRNTSWGTSYDSVTSSQIFEPGGDNQQVPTATNHHHHHCQNSDNSSHPFPTSEDILCMSTAEIEPCDLRMSTSDYFERILAIAGTIGGTLSDDGLSIVLCSHEHLMLLNLGNSAEKFEEHRKALAAFSEDNPWLDVDGDTDTGIDSRYRCLIKHKPLYSYVQRTTYENLDIETFIQHMRNACLKCTFVDNAYRVDTWEIEATHCMQTREIRKRLKREFDTRSNIQHVSTGSDTSSSTAVGNIAACSSVMFQGLNQNPVSTMVSAQNNSSAKSEVLLQQMGALPDFDELLSSENLIQDGVRSRGLPHTFARGQNKDHQQKSKQLMNQSSVVSPRIVRTQEEILKRIKRDSCSFAASMEAEKRLSDASGGCRKTYNDKGSDDARGFLTCREPVEQSYHYELDFNRSTDRGLVPQSDTIFSRQTACSDVHNYKDQPLRESQTEIKNSGRRQIHMLSESSIPRRQTNEGVDCSSRQSLADSDPQNTVTDLVSDKVSPDALSKSQLVLEKCRSGQTSQNDLTSGKIGGLHFSTKEPKDKRSSPRKETSKAKNEKFSVLEYIRSSCNVNAEPAASTASSHQEKIQLPVQQPACEEHQTARAQNEKVDERHIIARVDSRPSLGNTTILTSASPSVQNTTSSSESYLHLSTVSAGEHGRRSFTERQPQCLQPQLLFQGMGHSETSDDSQDSGRDSASVGNMNISGCASRPASDCDSSAFPRSRVVSSSLLSSSSHHAYSHVTSASESGYSSEPHFTGLLNARPGEGILSSSRHHQNYLQDASLHQAFTDIPFPFDGLHTHVDHTKGNTETSDRLATQANHIQAALTYIHALAQTLSFPGQDEFLQADTPQLPSPEQQRSHQQEGGLQTSNQITSNLPSSFPENLNNLSSREAVEQSWNETLMADSTPLSAQVGGVAQSGFVIRQELLLLENQIRQRECEISQESEEVTLAENVRSSQS